MKKSLSLLLFFLVLANIGAMMKDPGTRAMFQGVSLHHYSVVNGWEFKGSATNFDEREWFETLLLNIDMRCEDYTFGEKKIPSVTASASVDKDGKVHISMANLNPHKQITVSCPVIGETYTKVTGEVLTAGEINSFNSFEKPEIVKPVTFSGFTLKNGVLTGKMPSKSIIVLELSK